MLILRLPANLTVENCQPHLITKTSLYLAWVQSFYVVSTTGEAPYLHIEKSERIKSFWHLYYTT